MLINVPSAGNEWRQFRFTVGAPDAEAKFKTEQDKARSEDKNAQTYPSLYAFHGSPTKNWHSVSTSQFTVLRVPKLRVCPLVRLFATVCGTRQ